MTASGRSATSDAFATLDGEPHVCLRDVDRLAPFLMNVVSNGDVWIFAGSNTALTAGRRNPDCALFPYRTVDKLLRLPHASGVTCLLWVARGAEQVLWEPWRQEPLPAESSRHLYKHEFGTSVVFEETHHGLALRLRWRLEASEEFGLVRHARLANIGAAGAKIRSLDGWHHLLPPGVGQETYSRYSYLAAAYMRHELLSDVGLAIYTLNAAISDRAEPAESLRTSCAWSLGHRRPVRLLSERQVGAFRAGGGVEQETEIRGDFGAYLVSDEFELAPGESHEWFTVADIGLDHRALVNLRHVLSDRDDLRRTLTESTAANTRGLRRRVAAADGLQQTADRAASVHHCSNVLFNIMRGGAPDRGYECPRDDFAAFLRSRSVAVFARHEPWVAQLPQRIASADLRARASRTGDAQLVRLAREYLPLCFSRRHGDPSRPWNQFSIATRDADGRPVYGYSGNWRDIFQNWEALALSHPACLDAMIALFLNASTADGYNPYRITREGVDWEVHDPADPWSHIGYWGDHQLVYLLRLLESHERFWPGRLAAMLGLRAFACALVPYEIAGFDELVRDPRHSIAFNDELHRRLIARSAEIGADGKLLADADGQVRLVCLEEKLLVPVLVKLSNLVPGGGIWLNTQRPEWNDANNALAGWGLSVVTVCYLRRYLAFLDRLLASAQCDVLCLSEPVAELLAAVTAALLKAADLRDDRARYRVAEALGRAGESHRRAVYAEGDCDWQSVRIAAVREGIAAALPVVDATVRANRREDGTFHSYNLLEIRSDRMLVRHLDLMLEGQVAALSSGLLDDAAALTLLDALRRSPLWRADQRSYLLYPDREVAPFLSRNTLPHGWRTRAPVLAEMADGGCRALIVLDANGAGHFQSDLTNSADVSRRMAALAADPRWGSGLKRDADAVLDLWEQVFRHGDFTGRSGTMFAFEGLGSIYWHMVAKLLLAVQECHAQASDGSARARLHAAYAHVRDGLGFRKTAEEYGAFPTDAYSHTPGHAGAQQPGMTGQVKEEILTRFGEFGVVIADGCVTFAPQLLDPAEFSSQPSSFDYVDVSGDERTLDLPAGSLAFTFCQVPVTYQLGTEPAVAVHYASGERRIIAGCALPGDLSAELFLRTGAIASLTVTVPPTTQPRDLP